VLTNRAGEVEVVPPEAAGRIPVVPPEHQIPARIRGASTDPLVLQKTREVEAAKGEAEGFTLFPFTFAPLMPYLDGAYMFGNTCIQSGPVIGSDPLSSAGQWMKYQLAKVGLEYTLQQAYMLSVNSDRVQGDSALNAYAFRLVGDWKVLRDSDINGWVSFGANGGTGIGVDWEDQSPGGNIGALGSPIDAWYAKDFWISEAAWGMSFHRGELAILAGVIDQTNYFDLNTYANSSYGQLLNTAFVDSEVFPMPENNLGLNVAWQPSKSVYAILGLGTTNQEPGQHPFSHVSSENIAYLLELGLIQDDVLGLGRGTYRLQPFLATFEGATGAGLCFNLEQKLGKSPFGVFGRFGVGQSTVTQIGGASAEAAFGVSAIGPLADSGILATRKNDYLALGMGWTRQAVTDEDEHAIELTYAMQLTPTLTLQPDFQVVFDPVDGPGGHAIYLFQLQILLQW
jgi:porin